MNNSGEGLKKAAINKAKQSATNANGNGQKRRKQDLKPILTTSEQQQAAGGTTNR